MKARILYPAILLLFILSGIGWFFIRPNPEEKTFLTKKYGSGPVFKQEGKIFFIGSNEKDTLTVLDVEIADNPEEIMQGLMFRSNLNPNQGMFFIFPEQDEQIFWMKDTKISLDIIFVSNDLKIIHIARHTVPYSKEPIPSLYPAKYVVEVNAGFCDTHQIQKLGYIRYDIIK